MMPRAHQGLTWAMCAHYWCPLSMLYIQLLLELYAQNVMHNASLAVYEVNYRWGMRSAVVLLWSYSGLSISML